MPEALVDGILEALAESVLHADLPAKSCNINVTRLCLASYG